MIDIAKKFQSVVARRADFPSLKRPHIGHPISFLDGPAGTQVPQQVIDAIAGYYTTCNTNTHGLFPTSVESDRLLEQARAVVASFLGAASSRCISFGANMTTLAFSLSRAFGRALREGDEVLITQLDHEANRGPWLTLAEQGVLVREVAVKHDATLDYNDFRSKVNRRTRLIAMGLASNAFGTVNDVSLARQLASSVGAWLLADAVHYAPHFPIDATEMGIDFLLCSAYKFYGPHVGILYARGGLLETLQTDRLRTQDPEPPYRIETGTLNHAAIAGVKAAVEYIASLGSGPTLRERIVSAMQLIASYEHEIAATLYHGLRKIGGVTVHGESFDSPRRAPTVSFTVTGKRPDEVCSRLGEKGICTWNGHFYAIRPVEVLGLLENGGVTRVGISLYNIIEEIEQLLVEVERIAAS